MLGELADYFSSLELGEQTAIPPAAEAAYEDYFTLTLYREDGTELATVTVSRYADLTIAAGGETRAWAVRDFSAVQRIITQLPPREYAVFAPTALVMHTPDCETEPFCRLTDPALLRWTLQQARAELPPAPPQPAAQTQEIQYGIGYDFYLTLVSGEAELRLYGNGDVWRFYYVAGELLYRTHGADGETNDALTRLQAACEATPDDEAAILAALGLE